MKIANSQPFVEKGGEGRERVREGGGAAGVQSYLRKTLGMNIHADRDGRSASRRDERGSGNKGEHGVERGGKVCQR